MEKIFALLLVVAAVAAAAPGMVSADDGSEFKVCEARAALLHPDDFDSRAMGGDHVCLGGEFDTDCCNKLKSIFGDGGDLNKCLCNKNFFSSVIMGLPTKIGVLPEQYVNMLQACMIPIPGHPQCSGSKEAQQPEPLIQMQAGQRPGLLGRLFGGPLAATAESAAPAAADPDPAPLPSNPTPEIASENVGAGSYPYSNFQAPQPFIPGTSYAPYQPYPSSFIPPTQPALPAFPGAYSLPSASPQGPIVQPGLVPAVGGSLGSNPGQFTTVQSERFVDELGNIPGGPGVPPFVSLNPPIAGPPAPLPLPRSAGEFQEEPVSRDQSSADTNLEAQLNVPTGTQSTPESSSEPENSSGEGSAPVEIVEATEGGDSGTSSGDSSESGSDPSSENGFMAAQEHRPEDGWESDGGSQEDENVIDVTLDYVQEKSGCGDIVEVASEIPNLTVLMEVIKRAGVIDNVAGTDKVMTVLAPTNGAFGATLKAIGVTMDQFLANPGLMKRVLALHIIPGQALKSFDVSDGQKVKSLSGEEITFSVDQAIETMSVAVPSGVTSEVILKNLEACSAVVHVISTVLLPDLQKEGSSMGGETGDGGNESLGDNEGSTDTREVDATEGSVVEEEQNERQGRNQDGGYENSQTDLQGEGEGEQPDSSVVPAVAAQALATQGR